VVVYFRPFFGGVTVYADHLEGYAWHENIGWIRLGTFSGGGAHTYLNTTQTNYGVNRSGSILSGYGWSETSGWINFNPTDGGVTVNALTGSFDGYAWAENIGWIHFRGTGPAYNVVFDNTAPAFTGAPAISGTGLVGDTLSLTDTGTTDPDGDTVTLSYQWKSDGSNIGGATNLTYVVTASEVGKNITCTITATDPRGGTAEFTTAGVSGYCTYAVSPTAVTLTSAAATNQSFSVTTQAGCAWSATTPKTWIHTASTGTGSGTGSFDLDANTGAQRTGTITVGGQSITITQKMPKPAAPSGLTASGTGPVVLNWTDNATNEAGYRVYRRRSTETTWTKINDLGAGAAGHTDTTAVLETTYFYIVQAWNSGGVASSNTVKTQTGSITAPELTTVAIEPGTGEAAIEWKDKAASETGYEVWRRKAGEPGWTKAATLAADTEIHTDTGLSIGNLWFYQICATAGGGQACSAPKGGNGPTDLTAAEDVSGVDLVWTDNATDETEYRAYRKKSTEIIWQTIAAGLAADTEAYTDTTTATDTTYNYVVSASNAVGSVSGRAATITTGTLNPPDRVAATGVGSTATVTWRDNATTEGGYAVWRRYKSSGGWINTANLTANSAIHTDSGLTIGRIYTYQICATTIAGGQACSGGVSINGPTGLTVTYAPATGVTLNWTDASIDEEGFRIVRKATTETAWSIMEETGAGEISYTDTTAVSGTTYQYSVCAYNTESAGACSAIKKISIP